MTQPRDPDQRDGGPDLLTVALLVFFVSVIAVVGAMLSLPALL